MQSRRPEWWKIPLGDKCKLIDNVFFEKNQKYFSLSILNMLNDTNPEIVLLGGFIIPSNYMAYLWARIKKKRIGVICEEHRKSNGETKKSLILKFIIGILYRKIDIVYGAGDHGVSYFKNYIGFPASKVVFFSYPVDMEIHLIHPLRKIENRLNILFPNRMEVNYNPIFALQVFKEFSNENIESHIYLNSSGSMRGYCEKFIKENDLIKRAHFLTEINRWDDLPDVYKMCQICLSPSENSNGNISLLEAMASGMGMILSDKIKFNSDLIRKHKCGFVLSLKLELYIDALKHYVNDKNLLTLHGKINKQVATYYSIPKTTERFCDSLQKVCR
jgi:glycosyltransferase involved in cell wall biosynthesis